MRCNDVMNLKKEVANLETISQINYYSRYNRESHETFIERVNLLIRDSFVSSIQFIPETEDNVLSCYVTVMVKKREYV